MSLRVTADGELRVQMLFTLKERTTLSEHLPLLSCADSEQLLARLLPRGDRHPNELIRRLLEVRHRKRQASNDSAHAKQAATCDSS